MKNLLSFINEQTAAIKGIRGNEMVTASGSSRSTDPKARRQSMHMVLRITFLIRVSEKREVRMMVH